MTDDVDRELRNISKWINEKIKASKNVLNQAKIDERHYGGFEDCGDFYRESVATARERVSCLTEVKIGVDKYRKKLAHEAREKTPSEIEIEDVSPPSPGLN